MSTPTPPPEPVEDKKVAGKRTLAMILDRQAEAFKLGTAAAAGSSSERREGMRWQWIAFIALVVAFAAMGGGAVAVHVGAISIGGGSRAEPVGKP